MKVCHYIEKTLLCFLVLWSEFWFLQ